MEDTSSGIDPDLMPRLFTKFATRSGTGHDSIFLKVSLTHGGRIWAQNNPDGKGATSFFSLPIFKS